MGKSQLAILISIWVATACASAADISIAETARLIRNAERIKDAEGWATDMLEVLRQHDLDQSRENVCASIAIIDQESGFVADPAVPNLGQISETALREKFGQIPIAGSLAIKWLEKEPTRDDSHMSRIRKAKTERDLDIAYRRFVDDMTNRVGIAAIVDFGLLNSVIEERNDIDTAGSMQVSVKFALKTANDRRWLPMSLSDSYAVRDQLYVRQGGMYYGIKQLLDFETGYSQKIHRFADYNAGRYASRNAAFQKIISILIKKPLDLDGDLLLYDKGKASSRVSSTEKAIREADRSFQLGLNNEEIRADLLRADAFDFTSTKTFSRIRNLYQQRTGKQPEFAVLPDIDLSSPKIKRRMTTADFATSVNKRYQKCLRFQ
jgi:Protein of unknown function (DUF1615)